MNAAIPAGPTVTSSARGRRVDHGTDVINPARGGNNQSRHSADVDQESPAMLHLRHIECEATERARPWDELIGPSADKRRSQRPQLRAPPARASSDRALYQRHCLSTRHARARPGSTRVSIETKSFFIKMMDCRVKPWSSPAMTRGESGASAVGIATLRPAAVGVVLTDRRRFLFRPARGRGRSRCSRRVEPPRGIPPIREAARLASGQNRLRHRMKKLLTHARYSRRRELRWNLHQWQASCPIPIWRRWSDDASFASSSACRDGIRSGTAEPRGSSPGNSPAAPSTYPPAPWHWWRRCRAPPASG